MAIAMEDLRTIAALLIALSATAFWVAAIMQCLLWDGAQTGLSRIGATATALASSIMLGQIAYAFSCTTCPL